MGKNHFRLEPYSSIFDIRVGQAMHSSIGAWEEAQLLYIHQSRLSQAFLAPKNNPLVLYDVGLGIGANAFAAIDCFINHPEPRDFHLVSFETQIEGVLFALEHLDQFPFIRPDWVKQLLEFGSFQYIQSSGAKFFWELKIGDFRDFILNCPPAEIVFYDLYSPKTCPDLWNRETFRLLFRAIQSQARVFTYSSTKKIRASLLAAGFFVGQGFSTSKKKDTTVAALRLEDLEKPLDMTWFQSWRRSPSVTLEISPEIEARILMQCNS